MTNVEAGPSVIGSGHPGGANVALADGSVRFLSSGIDSQTIRMMLQPSDGQVVPPW
jgi:prepilin-type processing-associated H-X9-DG protein